MVGLQVEEVAVAAEDVFGAAGVGAAQEHVIGEIFCDQNRTGTDSGHLGIRQHLLIQEILDFILGGAEQGTLFRCCLRLVPLLMGS